MDFRDLQSGLERIERDSEQTLEKKEQNENTEISIRNAIAKLSDDIGVAQILEQRSRELEQQHRMTDVELEELRQRAETLKEQLQELVSQNSNTAAILMELQELGEDVSDSLGVMEERQRMIDESTQQLAAVIERLGMDAAEFSGGEGSLASLSAGAEAETESASQGDGVKSRHDAFVNQLREQANQKDHSPINQCCGVLAHGNFPQGYENVIRSRFQNASAQMQSLFSHFQGELIIQNAEYPADETAHYSPVNMLGHPRGVYYNAVFDAKNPRGAGTTYFHELGHMVDHAAGEYKRNLSDTTGFREALLADGRRAERIVSGLTPEQKKIFFNRISGDEAHSCSDLLDAVTEGRLSGNYGHSREYWNHSSHLQAEAFAHFFEASMGNERKLNLLKQVFPSAYKEFQFMISSITNPDEIRERER